MDLIASMRSRMPLTVGRAILKSSGIAVGQGWENTVEKFRSLEDSQGGVPVGAQSDAQSLYEQHLRCGEKSVRLYEIDPHEIDQLREAISAASVPSSEFKEIYPFLMDQSDLETVDDLEPHLVNISFDADETVLEFSSKRMIEIREKLSSSDLSEDARAEFGDVDEIITVRRGYRHMVDAISIPRSGNVVLARVDSPKDMPTEYSSVAHSKLAVTVNNTLGVEALTEGMNIFGAIDKIYKDPSEGTVVEMAFTTRTASIKHEKMRKKNLDLRTEIYHEAGSAAVAGKIDPFRISVRWKSNIGGLSTPIEASLNSTVRQLHSASPVLTEVIVRGCATTEQFQDVITRISNHV